MATVKLSDEALLAFFSISSGYSRQGGVDSGRGGELERGPRGGGRGRGTACRGDAAFGPRGVARLGGRAGRGVRLKLVTRRACRVHARAADQPPERRLAGVLDRARHQTARPRQLQPHQSLTKCRRLIPQLWFAPRARRALVELDNSRDLILVF